MKAFMDRDFLLSTETAKHLYHDFAAPQPIIDYHCHLSPQEIFEDRQFENITQVWLGGDHYKWRLMRSAGVEERFITGDATDREKFQKWAETVGLAVGNPLYHWSHLELRNYFGYEGVLNGDTAETVWQLCNEKLRSPEMSARKLIVNSNVKALCTTDDPADTLEWHKKIAEDESFGVKVLPSYRPDKALGIEKPEYLEYLARLGEIKSFAQLAEVLKKRLAFFVENGCRVSDHGMEAVPYAEATADEVETVFRKRLAGEIPTALEQKQFKTALLLELGREYRRLGVVMQLHFGVIRDNSRRVFRALGPDAGIDSIGDQPSIKELAAFLCALDDTGELPKTILYSLNPNDNAALVTVMGAFQTGEAVGKLQHGSAWWFNDHKPGMVEQLTTLAADGYLAGFVGMLTDSRSFLSYARHEYFRRILCELIGSWVENGEFANDEKALRTIVEGICVKNAERYFDL
ncbi:MAG: glucuronate isomerase [Oscillospiraceae bacterium]|nr:glucuronate isomerase [Oscillospiraceae bacterium]